MDFLRKLKTGFAGVFAGVAVTLGIWCLVLDARDALAQGLGEIGTNISGNISGLAKAMLVGGFALGLYLVISGLMEFYNANKKPGASFGGGAIKCGIGACLLATEAIIASFSATIFGGNESGTGLGALGF
ncbi:MAG: hypothetical protein LBF41_09680 [Deltaproteobacteria bacterium]|jgi:hypothetical protein|nr:hypothetical protein [Deltaproteobacteria bacterium]